MAGIKNAKHGSNPPQTFICKGCGEPFERIWFPSRLKPQYCTTACRKKRIMVICKSCGKEFETFKYREDTTKYCSVKCRIAGVTRENSVCKQCGKEFHGNRRNRLFCCLQCAADYRKATRLHKKCETCGKKFVVKKGYINARFCSLQCSAISIGITHRGENHPNWKGGHDGDRGDNWHEQSWKARKRDNYTCQICGLHRKNNPALPVHHIKPYREFNGDYLTANRLENLITLCPRCHTTVENAERPRDKLGRLLSWQVGQWAT